ncbi:hypothetical protein BDV24DRAFT_160011 [Aspergillus arachidicola]|uniref:Uncharacterized protein n=1 Tax=Aspergillus arachidicola TaxID=656916 RepID=A0A5N6YGX0_9EURO|nr:hypothetical protein BDV24DRAFT_160011 [Aspergillus arachidicola]
MASWNGHMFPPSGQQKKATGSVCLQQTRNCQTRGYTPLSRLSRPSPEVTDGQQTLRSEAIAPTTHRAFEPVDLTTTTPPNNPLGGHGATEQSRTPSPMTKLKRFNETIWKEMKEVFNGFRGKRDAEIATLKQQLEEANNELLGKQQRIDSLEEYLTERGLF